jgi:Domain of unknown function DUF29
MSSGTTFSLALTTRPSARADRRRRVARPDGAALCVDVGKTLHSLVGRPGYDADLVLWAEDQADALRRAAATASNLGIDWANVAQEIGNLANNEKRSLTRMVGTILVHLIKLQISPAIGPRASWRRTIRVQRAKIKRLLKRAKSLADTIPAVIEEALADIAGHDEIPRGGVAQIAFTEAEVRDDWWPPEASSRMASSISASKAAGRPG